MLRLMTSGKACILEISGGEEGLSVCVLIAAYNAAGKIESKLRNALALDYLKDKLEVIVVSDGSTDDTALRAKALDETNVFVHEIERN